MNYLRLLDDSANDNTIATFAIRNNLRKEMKMKRQTGSLQTSFRSCTYGIKIENRGNNGKKSAVKKI